MPNRQVYRKFADIGSMEDMNKIIKTNKCKNKSELGASLVEYGLLVALIAIVVIPAVRTTGINVNCIFEVVGEGIIAPPNMAFDVNAAKANCAGSGGGS